MNQCLKITIDLDKLTDSLIQDIQAYAQSLKIEGTIQFSYEHKHLKIYACGLQNAIEDFVDAVHQVIAHTIPNNIFIEPFAKQKDYRGVFRIIE